MKRIFSLFLCAIVLFGVVLVTPINAKALTADDVRALFADSPREIEDYAYSFAIVGDTQIVTYNDTFSKNNNLNKIYDWIVANSEEKKMSFCFGLGDITDTNMPAEWAHAYNQISKMDGVVPYTLVRGNHDLPLRYGIPDDTVDYFSLYLGTDTYLEQFEDGRNVQLEYYSTVQDAYFAGAERNIEVAVVSPKTGKVTNPSTQGAAAPQGGSTEEPTEATSGSDETTQAADTTESVEKDNKKSDSSKTGDNTNLGIWIAIVLVSVCAIVALVIYGKKKPTKE